MRIRTKLAATVLGLASLLSSAARADFIPIAMPDAAYLGGTRLSLRAGFQRSDVAVRRHADRLVRHRHGGAHRADDWASWASPPNTESATPRVLWTNGFTSDGARPRAAFVHLRL